MRLVATLGGSAPVNCTHDLKEHSISPDAALKALPFAEDDDELWHDTAVASLDIHSIKLLSEFRVMFTLPFCSQFVPNSCIGQSGSPAAMLQL